MSKNFKYLKSYSKYILEQDMGMPADPAAGGAAPPPQKSYNFIFIPEGDRGSKKYPDGSSYEIYQSYEMPEPDLDKWLESNVISSKEKELADSALKVKRTALKEFISGKRDKLSPDDIDFIEKFKNTVSTTQKGAKRDNIEVIFSQKDGTPYTEDLDVTFIIIPKKK
jgi:hypothetical protein